MPCGLVIGDKRGDALAVQPTDLDSAGWHGFGAIVWDTSKQAKDTQACPKALFRMWATGEDCDNQAFRLGPMDAAQRRKRSGVHSAYRRWELGI